MQVDELMKKPECCRASDSARDCALLMKSQNIGFVPICNEANEPIGTITDRDLALRVLAENKPADIKLDDVMTKDVVGCRSGDDLSEAVRLMRERRKSRIMVCDNQGKLLGVISLSDIAEREPEEVAGQALKDVASREAQQPQAS